MKITKVAIAHYGVTQQVITWKCMISGFFFSVVVLGVMVWNIWALELLLTLQAVTAGVWCRSVLKVYFSAMIYNLWLHAPIHSCGTLKFSKYWSFPQLKWVGCMTFFQREEEGHLVMNHDPILNIITAAVGMVIKCIHFAVTVYR